MPDYAFIGVKVDKYQRPVVEQPDLGHNGALQGQNDWAHPDAFDRESNLLHERPFFWRW